MPPKNTPPNVEKAPPKAKAKTVPKRPKKFCKLSLKKQVAIRKGFIAYRSPAQLAATLNVEPATVAGWFAEIADELAKSEHAEDRQFTARLQHVEYLSKEKEGVIKEIVLHEARRKSAILQDKEEPIILAYGRSIHDLRNQAIDITDEIAALTAAPVNRTEAVRRAREQITATQHMSPLDTMKIENAINPEIGSV